MLALERKLGEKVIVDETLEITVLKVRGKKVVLGFHGPQKVLRQELVVSKDSDTNQAKEVP